MIHVRYTGSDVIWPTFTTMTVLQTTIIMWPNLFKHYNYYRVLPKICLHPIIFTHQTVLSILTQHWDFAFKASQYFRKVWVHTTTRYNTSEQVSDQSLFKDTRNWKMDRICITLPSIAAYLSTPLSRLWEWQLHNQTSENLLHLTTLYLPALMLFI